ncbi:MAG: branched-chain amino acid ABC transporter permease [Gammaproteobacteria bacterium]|jgi:branched-chain amino acid transport system permease protein|nr:branched-chain amino acid ABC transporter permease [Gammaproteobacteria bacterium]
MFRTSLTTNLILICLLVVLAALPPFLGIYYGNMVTRLMILGIFAMSLDLLIGFTGLVSFGHAAFFGLSGYILGIVMMDTETASIYWVLPACLGVTALASLVIGWFSVRTSGIYFIMITLAFAQMLFYFFNENTALGGSDGMFIFAKPTLAIGSWNPIDFEDHHTFYYVVLVSLILSYLGLRRLLNAPFGQVIQGIRTNEDRTRALGFATRRYKLVSFIIAGTLAGFAGFLEAMHTSIISPAHLGWHESGNVMMTVILGGIGTLHGPVLGAFAFGFLHDWLQDVTEHPTLYMGIFVIAVVLFLPRGIAGLPADIARWLRRKPPGDGGSPP